MHVVADGVERRHSKCFSNCIYWQFKLQQRLLTNYGQIDMSRAQIYIGTLL